MSSSPAKKSAGIAALIVHHSITVLILVLFLALGVWSYLTFQNADFFASVDRQAHVNELRPAVVEAQSQRLHFAIEVYQQLTGRTPGSLNELVEMGFLRESDLYYPGGPNIWVYERLPDGFRLTRENPES
jgi:hypothetical protein